MQTPIQVTPKPPDRPTGEPSRGKAFFDPWRVGLCAIFIAAIAAYWTSLTGQLVWDDHLIVEYHRQGANSLWGALTTHFLSYYRPLTGASYYLDGAIFGAVPFNYHVTNMAIHAVASVLVAWAGWSMFRDRLAGLAAGTFFALQPAQVAATAWIGGRTDDLSCLFVAAFIGTLVEFVRSEKRSWLIASTSFFFCALLTKEQNIPFMLAAPLAAYAFSSKGGSKASSKGRTLGRPLWMSFGGASLVFLVLIVIQRPDVGSLSHTPLAVTLERVGQTTLHYTWFFLVPGPIGLASFSLGRYEFVGAILAGWALFGGLFFAAWLGWRRNRAVGFALCGILLAYLPISNLVPIPSLLVGPYRVAVAGVFVALLLGFGLSYGWRRRRPLTWVLATANLLLGAFWTVRGAAYWRSEGVFFAEVVANDPWSLIGQSMNANQLLDENKGAQALGSTDALLNRVYGNSVWQDPTRIGPLSGPGTRAWNTISDNAGTRGQPPAVLGNYLLLRSEALRLLNRDSESLLFARAAVQMDPNNGDSHAVLGDLLRKSKRALAVREYELAVQFSPGSWQYLRRLASERYNDHRYAEAAVLYRRAIVYAGWFGGLWIGLSDALAGTGDIPGALAALDSAQKAMVMNQKEIDSRRVSLLAKSHAP